MTRDPIDERAEHLFAAARLERAPEATQQRIAFELRNQVFAQSGARKAQAWWATLRAPLLAGGMVVAVLWPFVVRDSEPQADITAEAVSPVVDSPQPDRSRSSRPSRQDPAEARESPSSELDAPQLHQKEPRPTPTAAPRGPVDRSPATLEEELASMQRARALLDGGDARGALRELQHFASDLQGKQLGIEASLLRIETLAQLGRHDEARTLARRFVAEHPNDPLVDRAAQFAEPPGPGPDAAPANTEGK